MALIFLSSPQKPPRLRYTRGALACMGTTEAVVGRYEVLVPAPLLSSPPSAYNHRCGALPGIGLPGPHGSSVARNAPWRAVESAP